jgi:hypothetical protein
MIPRIAMSLTAAAAVAAVAAALAGCSNKGPEASAPQISEKVFNVTPASVKVKAGIVGGELSGMRVTERVEEGSGRVDYGPRLSGRLVLRNLSSDQSVLVDGGKLVFADSADRPIATPSESSPPSIRLGDSYNSTSARLDPGQEITRDIDVDFPCEALKAGKLHEIRVQLHYTAAPFRRDLLEFPVALSAKAQ